MTNLLKVFLIGVLSLATGCESLSRWKMAGTRAVVSFIPREVDKHLGELAVKSQAATKQMESVPEEAHRLIRTLAEPLLNKVAVPPLEPSIHIIESEAPNAFAYPHGGIFVTTKLLQISKSPDEVLAVLAHELAHVVQRHSMQQMTTQLGTSLAINLVFGDYGALADLASSGGQLLTLKFSRDHERDADSVGADILRMANLPLSGMAEFFERMNEYEKSQKELPLDKNILSFLATHPSTEERIQAARSLVSPTGSTIPVEQINAYLQLKKIYSAEKK